MTICGPKDIELHFESSGIKVNPIEVNSYDRRNKFNSARIRVTREAGVHIANHHTPKEPVSLLSNGNHIQRFYIQDNDDAISLSEDDAYIRLADELQILDETVVNKDYGQKWALSEIISDLLELSHTNDPENVINQTGGFRSPGFDFREEEVIQATDVAAEWSVDIPMVGAGLGDLSDWLGVQIRNHSWNPMQSTSGFDFEDQTVWACLKDIAEKYEFDIFVDENNFFGMGSLELKNQPTIYAGGPSNETLNLINLSTPFTEDQIKSVKVRGGNIADNYEDVDSLRGEAIAVRPNVDGRKQLVFDRREVDNIKDLEVIAERLLFEHIRDSNSGNITVDPLSSVFNSLNPKQIDIGDFFYVEPFTDCRRTIQSGIYIVDEVHHQLSSWHGWKINLTVNGYPESEFINQSYYYNPIEDEYKGEIDYEKDNDSDPGDGIIPTAA